MEPIYQKLADIEKQGIPACICTIIETTGSVPRKAGAKMIVYPDGTIEGTVGGGLVEKKTIEKALEVLSSNQKTIFEFNLVPEQGMTCGGLVRIFIEPVNTLRRLYIFGAGHIGRFLAQLAVDLHFSVTVIDDRTGIMNSFSKQPIETLNMPYTEALGKLSFNHQTFICVLTQSHTLDREVTAWCARLPYAYLGVIGSINKIASLKEYYLQNNILTIEQLSRINWPIGIGIACNTPQEIAISILAGMIDVRNKMNV